MIWEVLEKIESSGVDGIKKTDLKKTFGKNCEKILENLKETEQIFIEKKGTAFFIWTRENFVHHITQNDPKFKLMLNMLVGVSQSLAKVKVHAEILQEEMEKFYPQVNSVQNNDFESFFNKTLNESSNSIGWVPFNTVRERVCENQKLSKETFYQMASDLIVNHKDRYEVSSGGQEGILMRGLVHGFVRNI
jgi:hypothetical protein